LDFFEACYLGSGVEVDREGSSDGGAFAYFEGGRFVYLVRAYYFVSVSGRYGVRVVAVTVDVCSEDPVVPFARYEGRYDSSVWVFCPVLGQSFGDGSIVL
jgi:hypothetical protein